MTSTILTVDGIEAWALEKAVATNEPVEEVLRGMLLKADAESLADRDLDDVQDAMLFLYENGFVGYKTRMLSELLDECDERFVSEDGERLFGFETIEEFVTFFELGDDE